MTKNIKVLNNIMCSDYYTPVLSEFVQGFKFERLETIKGSKIGAVMYLDEEYNKKHGRDFFAEKDIWVEFSVFWKEEPEWTTIKYGEIYITSKALPEFDWIPWINNDYILDLLAKGKIRAIKNNSKND